jgi:hypothetical protein
MSCFDSAPETRKPSRGFATISGSVLALALALLPFGSANADDSEAIKLFKAKGAEVKETMGVVTALSISDGTKLTDEDFRQIGRFAGLKTLTLSNCLNDRQLELLTGLSSLEYLQTNLADVTDDGIKPLAKLKGLKTLKFFHPGKSFTGAGLAHLTELPVLQSLTVAGSLSFGDEGMAAAAKLTGLKELRTWHAGFTDEGVKKLTVLKNLRSLYLGQRLTYNPPACPTDQTLAILVEIKSLESLQLDEARLTLDALRQVKQLPAMKKLTLGGIDIPKGQVEQLRKDLPDIKIEWTEPNEVYQKRIRALFGGR